MTTSRPRPAALVAAIVLLLTLLPAAPGSASNGTAVPYLALGDSVPYGWDVVTQSFTSPPASHVGYPETLAQRSPLVVTNAACPGETSGSFVDPSAPDNGCDAVRGAVGIKTDWGGGAQLDFAEDFLAAHPDTGLVSLQMGANDVFICQAGDDDDGDGLPDCTPEEFGQVLTGIAGNVVVTLARLRAAGYDGPVVLVAYYVFDYTDPAQVASGTAWRGVLQAIADSPAFGDVVVADGYAAFEQASRDFGGDPCAAGLLLPEGDGVCNVHTTPRGDQVLTQAVRRVVDLGAIVSSSRG